jgi:hypothetical protein
MHTNKHTHIHKDTRTHTHTNTHTHTLTRSARLPRFTHGFWPTPPLAPSSCGHPFSSLSRSSSSNPPAHSEQRRARCAVFPDRKRVSGSCTHPQRGSRSSKRGKHPGRRPAHRRGCTARDRAGFYAHRRNGTGVCTHARAHTSRCRASDRLHERSCRRCRRAPRWCAPTSARSPRISQRSHKRVTHAHRGGRPSSQRLGGCICPTCTRHRRVICGHGGRRVEGPGCSARRCVSSACYLRCCRVFRGPVSLLSSGPYRSSDEWPACHSTYPHPMPCR